MFHSIWSQCKSNWCYRPKFPTFSEKSFSDIVAQNLWRFVYVCALWPLCLVFIKSKKHKSNETWICNFLIRIFRGFLQIFSQPNPEGLLVHKQRLSSKCNFCSQIILELMWFFNCILVTEQLLHSLQWAMILRSTILLYGIT